MASSQQQTCPNGSCTDDSPLPTVQELLSQPPPKIINVLGGIYEHSPWVAETFVKQDNLSKITTVTELAERLKSIVDDAPQEQKLQLLNAHPDLCEKVEKMKELTAESQEEQSKAGLQSMEGDELANFKEMNTSYKAKFGFPFILAVRNASKHTVLSALSGRLPNPTQQEFVTAVQQVHKIAWMRLLSKVNTDDAKGFLTCHGTFEKIVLYLFYILCVLNSSHSALSAFLMTKKNKTKQNKRPNTKQFWTLRMEFLLLI
jgi:2-oxo-4-hydroxy-4-carboxy-5-ureidoimidazoline decarboxylase